MDKQLESILCVLKEKDNFVVVTHSNPDGDAIGSAFALFYLLKKLKKRCRIFCSDPVPENFKFLSERPSKEIAGEGIFELANTHEKNLDAFKNSLVSGAEKNFDDFKSSLASSAKKNLDAFKNSLVSGAQKSLDILENNLVIGVDIADKNLLGESLESLLNVDISIDHHHSSKNFATFTFLDELASATCEIIYEIANSFGLIDAKIATCIYTGIMTDTGSFRYSNVTPKTHRIIAELLEKGANNKIVNKNVFENKSKEQMKLHGFILESLDFFCDQRCAMISITSRMLLKSGASAEDTHCFSHIPRQIKGVLVGITVREEKENLYKVSLRTEDPIDAASICEKFGGGGHVNAAGCVIAQTLEKVKEMILSEVRKALDDN